MKQLIQICKKYLTFLFSLNQLKSDSESPYCLIRRKFNLSLLGLSPLGSYKVLGSYLALTSGRDPPSHQPTLVTTETWSDPVQHSPAIAFSAIYSQPQTANFFIFLENFLFLFSHCLQRHWEYSLQWVQVLYKDS